MLSVPLLPHFSIWVVFRDLFHLFLDVAPHLSIRPLSVYLSPLPFTSSSSPVGALLLIGESDGAVVIQRRRKCRLIARNDRRVVPSPHPEKEKGLNSVEDILHLMSHVIFLLMLEYITVCLYFKTF